MSLVCAVTGEVPEEAVYCSKTNLLYEKRVILKHIAATGVCPVSSLQLEPHDLLPVKTNPTIKPRPLSASSIPGLLSCLQTEWDALMSEAFSLKTHLEQVRKQLAHALYQQDAATRVIARLLKERDAAQQQLQQQQQLVLQLQRSAAAAADSADADLGVSEELVEEMQSLARQLLSQRKKRKPVGFVAAAAAADFTCTLSLPLHSAAARGVFKVAADTNPARHAAVFGSSSSSSSGEGGGSSGESAAAAAGEEGAAAAAAAAAGVGGGEGKVISVSSGADGAIVFFNLHEQKQIAKVQAHAKACRTFLLHPTEPLVISGSDDKTVKIWRGSNDFSSSFTLGVALRRQRGDICGLALHPLNDYFAAAAADSTWSFIGIKEGRYLSVYKDLSSQYSSLAFHPDGMIMGGGGVDGNIYIWDMKGQQQRAALQGHSDRITKLTFSENGYYLATASADGTVRLWDLRKSASFQTLELGGGGKDKEKEVATSVVFDYSGLFLAASSSSGVVSLYNFASRANASLVATLQGHTDAVMDCAFVEGEKMLLTASMDKTVKVWQIPNN